MNRISCTFLVLFYFLVSASHAGVPANFDYTSRVETTQPPKRLFHWVSRHRLELWADKVKRNDGKFIFPHKIQSTSSFSNIVKVFAKRNGVFTWINPVFSKQSFIGENYGGTSPALLVFDIKPSAKAIRIVSEHNDPREDLSNLIEDAGINTRTVQLVEFITPRQHEWLLFNSRAVEQFTADPHVTMPMLKMLVENSLKNPDHIPHFKDIHYRHYHDNHEPWRPFWFTKPMRKSPIQFNHHNFDVVQERLRLVLEGTPDSPYFKQSAFNEVTKYESLTHASYRPLPKVMYQPFTLSCEDLLAPAS